MAVNGFLLIDKNVDWTSRDVCNKASRILQTKKSGHIGTLDPFATGLMIIALGEATKALPFVNDDKKTYIAELVLGKKTSSGDKTNEIVEEKEVPELNKEIIIQTLKSFLGKSKQIPPMASAISINGQRLYDLFRKGEKVDVPSRDIEVYDIKYISYDNHILLFEVTVSKGTYIRTLGEDIADKLGTVGYLNNLRRTKIDDISVSNSIKIDEVDESKIITIDKLLSYYLPSYITNDNEIKFVKNGMDLTINKHDEDKIIIKNKNDVILAIYGKTNGHTYHCLRGFNLENN